MIQLLQNTPASGRVCSMKYSPLDQPIKILVRARKINTKKEVFSVAGGMDDYDNSFKDGS